MIVYSQRIQLFELVWFDQDYGKHNIDKNSFECHAFAI